LQAAKYVKASYKSACSADCNGVSVGWLNIPLSAIDFNVRYHPKLSFNFSMPAFLSSNPELPYKFAYFVEIFRFVSAKKKQPLGSFLSSKT